jgi:hypothetical protein
MHHGYNPEAFRFFHEDDGIGKIAAQMPVAGGENFQNRSGLAQASWMSRSISS